MFDTIVLGHDGTPGASGAAQLACGLARLTGARLLVATAFPEHPLTVRLHTSFEDGDPAAAAAALEAARTTCPGGVEATYTTVAGASVHAALHDLAARERADLIVVGPSRHPAAFVQRSPCAVALAPPSDVEPTFEHVGVACDGSSASRTALALARELAALPEGPVRRLDLVLVEPRGYRYHLELHDPGLFVRERSPAAVWLEHAARQPAGAARVRAFQRIGEPAAELVALSAGWDLLFTGSRNRGPARRLLPGSVSSRVAREASCPVIISPRLPIGAAPPRALHDGHDARSGRTTV